MHLAPGIRLDVYEILGPLGAGGMGEVYRARDSNLKREVAIKILPAFVSQDPDRLRRFEQEAQAAAALNHPNILAVHRFGTFEGAPYLVSEFLEGETLRQQLERGPLPERKSIDYGVQIAHGLAAAHDKGIVHRDLKPENLFVTRNGRIKILDFGLAKLMRSETDREGSEPTQASGTDPGTVLGTVGYMSPEQVRGTAVDHRADIFAFGTILYEMLSGKRAFQRTTSAETMTAILNEDPPAISKIVETIPPGLQRVLHRCLEKNPEQRFQSASDLAFALDALSDSGFTSAPHEAQRPKTVRRAIAWSAGALVVAALAAFAYFMPRQQKIVPFEHFSIQKAMDSEHVKCTAISPDGAYLAAVITAANGDESLVVHHIRTGSERPIVQNAAYKYEDVIFSPDGDYIYYRIHALDHSNRDDVYRIPLLGGQPSRIIEDVDAPISFLNRGQRVCFYRQYLTTPYTYKFLSASVDGGDEQVLATGKAPLPSAAACAPDGRRAIVADNKNANVEVLDFASGSKRNLISMLDTGGLRDLRWERDGAGVYVINVDNLRGQISFLSYPEGNLRQITNDLGNYEGISLTPDTKTIATTLGNFNGKFETLSLAEPSHLEEHGPPGLWNFIWLDNEKIIASDEESALRSVDLQTGETTSLNTPKGIWYHPALCGPDSLVVTRQLLDQQGSQIYRMHLDGSRAIQLTQGRQDIFPQCTPDGKWLFYMDYSGSASGPAGIYLMRQPLKGGTAQRVAKAYVSYGVSPDGKLLAFVAYEPSVRIKIISTETLQEIHNFPLPSDYGYAIAFSADSKSFFYNTITSASVALSGDLITGGGTTIWRQPLDTTTPVKVASFPGRIVVFMKPSPDGTKLGLATSAPQAEAVLIRDTR